MHIFDRILLVVAFISVIVAGYWFDSTFWAPIRETRVVVDSEVDQLMGQVHCGIIDIDRKADMIIVDCTTRDAWNQLLSCSIHINKDFVSVICISRGPDGIPGNSDDIVGCGMNLNSPSHHPFFVKGISDE